MRLGRLESNFNVELLVLLNSAIFRSDDNVLKLSLLANAEIKVKVAKVLDGDDFGLFFVNVNVAKLDWSILVHDCNSVEVHVVVQDVSDSFDVQRYWPISSLYVTQ